MSKETEEIEKKTVDIIVSPAENIGYSKRLDEDIVFKVVPERGGGVEKAAGTAVVPTNDVGKKFEWIFY